MKNTKARLLAAVFAEAKKRGIDAEFLRDVVAPAVIGKRLSEASPRECCRLLDHVTGSGGGSYESSLAGLKEEIAGLARARFGEDFERPLNALCARFGAKRWQWLTLRRARAVKAAIRRLQKEGPYNP